MTWRVLLLIGLTFGSPSAAAPLARDDLPWGGTAALAAHGIGDVRDPDHQGNFLSRPGGRAKAPGAFSAKTTVGIAIAGDTSAARSGSVDACPTKASAGRGTTLPQVARVRLGEDDVVAMQPAGVRPRASVANKDWNCRYDNSGAGGAKDDAAERRPLDLAFLTGVEPLTAPRDLSLFAPSSDLPSGVPLEGVLRIVPDKTGGGARILKDDSGSFARSETINLPPVLEIALVSDGRSLIPAFRGPIPADHPDWEWIVEPGVTWTDPADRGWSRAALPFALQERNANCTHNGVLTFLYRADARTSRVAWEVAGETCAYFKVDLWGMAKTRLTPGRVSAAPALIAAYRAEVAARLPTRPIEQIASVFPSIAPAELGSVLEVEPDNMTAYGFLAGGVHWVGGCRTRHGLYPFCDVLDLPSYSLSKSIFASLAMMRLQLLWPGVVDERIGARVPACRGPRWDDVRFGDALDMATGNYDSLGYEVDEGGSKMPAFFRTDSHATRARLACAMFPRRARPGRQWAYHTVDTYLLGTGMQDFLRRHRGPDADIYRDLIVTPIWRPLGLSPVTYETKRSYDGARQPFTGWGLTLHRDDIVRIARFVASGGTINGKPILDPVMRAAAMQRDPAHPGLETGVADQRYNHGYWAWNIARVIGCDRPVWVPFMSGYGGISVAMFPNGVIYYYFSDGGDYTWRRAAEAADKVQSMCRT